MRVFLVFRDFTPFSGDLGEYISCFTTIITCLTNILLLIHDICTGTCHAILHTWYMTPVLAMLYLTHDTRHWYLSCYIWPMISDTGTCHAIPDPDIWHWYLPCYTWHLIYDIGTCRAILDTWYITPVPDMLYLTPNACITWHMHDYYIITSHLVLMYLLYSWTPVLLYLLYSYSC